MSELHRTNYLGYLLQDPTDPEDFDEIAEAGSPWANYQFGLRDRSFGNFPEEKQEIFGVTMGGSRERVGAHIGKTWVESQVQSANVNGQGFYFLLGNAAADAGPADHKLTVLDSGAKPTRTVRGDSSSADGSANLRRHWTGMKTGTYSEVIDQTQKNLYVAQNENMFGYQEVAGQDSAVPPSFMGSVDDPYKIDSNFLFRWNADFAGGGDDYAAELNSITYIGDSGLRIDHIQNQLYPNTIIEGDYIHGITMILKRGNDLSIYNDWKNQKPNDTFLDLNYRVYQSATNYREVQLTEMSIQDIFLNDPFNPKLDESVYTIFATGTKIEVFLKDGIATSFYGY